MGFRTDVPGRRRPGSNFETKPRPFMHHLQVVEENRLAAPRAGFRQGCGKNRAQNWNPKRCVPARERRKRCKVFATGVFEPKGPKGEMAYSQGGK
jgi:hypothetical protein